MLENTPSQSTMAELLGQSLFEVWQALNSAIEEKYEMERVWNTGGKNWRYEYKYRRGGKTLCSLYAKKDCIGFMIIFGKDESSAIAVCCKLGQGVSPFQPWNQPVLRLPVFFCLSLLFYVLDSTTNANAPVTGTIRRRTIQGSLNSGVSSRLIRYRSTPV